MSIGDRIKEARRARRIMQSELAEMTHSHPVTVSRWERNVSSPDSKMLSELADALNTTVAYLTGETDNLERVSSTQTQPIARRPSILEAKPKPTPGLEFWGAVVDAARDAAERRKPEELEDVYMMLSRALAAVEDARNAVSLEQESTLPVAASA